MQRLVAGSVHWGLYGLLIVQPLVGWAATSAYRAPIIVYGLFELPPILPVNQPLSERLFAVHRGLGILMAVLVCAHAGAALYHHFVRRDRVLMRMDQRSAEPTVGRCDFGNDARTPPFKLSAIRERGPNHECRRRR